MVDIIHCSSDNRTVVQVNDIIIQIKKGESVDWHDVVIVGDLKPSDLPSVSLERTLIEVGILRLNETAKLVNSSILIANSEIRGNVSFDNIIFQRPISFVNTVFDGYADFRGSKFKKQTYFGYSNFKNFTNFDGTDFGYSSFERARFIKDASFKYANFMKDATFYNVTFFGDVSFSISQFIGKFIGDSALFFGSADFGYSKFHNSVVFDGSLFSGETNFEESQFNKTSSFRNAIFKGESLFSDSKFKENVLFENAIFQKNLHLTRSRFDKMYIRWNNIKKNLYYDDETYISLIENFKELGYYNDADNCYYLMREKQFLNREIGNDPLMFFVDLGAWILYGFGKRPLYPLLWSLYFITFFGFIWMAIGLNAKKKLICMTTILWSLVFFSIFRSILFEGEMIELWLSIFFIAPLGIFWVMILLKKSDIWNDEYYTAKKWPRGLSEAVFFSSTVFLSGTRLFVDPPAIPEPQKTDFSLTKKLFIIERLIGALFSLLFFLALTGMVIRPL